MMKLWTHIQWEMTVVNGEIVPTISKCYTFPAKDTSKVKKTKKPVKKEYQPPLVVEREAKTI